MLVGVYYSIGNFELKKKNSSVSELAWVYAASSGVWIEEELKIFCGAIV